MPSCTRGEYLTYKLHDGVLSLSERPPPDHLLKARVQTEHVPMISVVLP